jgi:EAL domain-containing protein (putative c-di-GMP-specific phosphodiesterase class I)
MAATSLLADITVPECDPGVRADTGSQQPPSRFRLEATGRTRATQRRRNQRELDAALKAQNFTLQFQPVVRLDDGAVVGAEAQLRWPHGKTGVHPATGFMALAEQTGQIAAIGGWWLSQACDAAATAGWPQAWPVDWTVTVSVSFRQLSAGVVLSQVAAALGRSELAAERLDIVLQEPQCGDVSVDDLLALSALRDLGVGVVLGGFGTGAASLSALKRLPLTGLRLDRSLIRDIAESAQDAAILRAIVQTGHALGLQMTATGVETEAQCGLLAGCGCDAGQGTRFGQALPAELLKPGLLKRGMKKP